MRTAFVVGILIVSNSIGIIRIDSFQSIILYIAFIFWAVSDFPDFMKGLREIKNILMRGEAGPAPLGNQDSNQIT